MFFKILYLEICNGAGTETNVTPLQQTDQNIQNSIKTLFYNNLIILIRLILLRQVAIFVSISNTFFTTDCISLLFNMLYCQVSRRDGCIFAILFPQRFLFKK